MVLGPQVKDSQVVILAVVLLEATQVILEDLATLRLVILGVELLLEPLVLAILVGDLIHHPKGVTLLMVTPKGHLEVIHPQVFETYWHFINHTIFETNKNITLVLRQLCQSHFDILLKVIRVFFQAQAIPTDLKAVQWGHLVDMLLVLQVPHPPKYVAVALHGVW